ncbi:MAG: hypothetical protein IPJ24_04770 [bacterium]|nr:hypothetical protein [bacterium]
MSTTRSGFAAAGASPRGWPECDVVVAGNPLPAGVVRAALSAGRGAPDGPSTRLCFAPSTGEVAGARPPAVGWIGTSTNYPSLLMWQDALREVLGGSRTAPGAVR